ncbi:MAG: (d)CMP kinase, partial [Chloroflexota bacterium]
MIVAIDGPAGAGKSTVARRLAERLGFRYLDTGAMYRALAWLALREGVGLEDEDELARLAAAHPVALGTGRVVIAGVDVSQAIRSAQIDRAVPVVARHPRVRAVMRQRQRELAKETDAVV